LAIIQTLWRSGVGYILLSVLGYSLFPVFVRGLGESGMPSLDIAAWRFVISVPMLWAIVFLRRFSASAGGQMPRLGLVLTGVFMCGAAVAGIIGIQLIPAAVYVLLFYSYPSMVALISVLRGERLERNAWLALVLTLIGIALTMPDLSAGFGDNANMQGVLMALLNAIAVAIYYVLNSRLLRDVRDTPRATAYSMTGAALPLYVWAIANGLNLPRSGEEWLLLLGFTAFSTVIPIIALNAGIQRLGAPKAALFSTLEPVLTLVWSVLLLGDIVLPVQLLGGALILASLVLLQARQLRPSGVSARRTEEALPAP